MPHLGMQRTMVPGVQATSLTTGSINLPGAKQTFGTTVASTPPITSTLNRWYDASDLASLTLSGDKVSQWSDKSGNGIHVTNGTASQQPTLILNSIAENRHAVLFNDATGDNLKSTTQPTSGSSSGTIFFVGRTDAYGTDQTAVSWGTSNSVGAGISLLFTGSANSDRASSWAWGYAGSLAGNYAFGANSHAGELNVVAGTFAGTALTIRINETDNVSNTAAGSSVASNSEFYLGWLTNPWYDTYGYNGIICEVLVYTSALSLANQQSVVAWLKSKWGIA